MLQTIMMLLEVGSMGFYTISIAMFILVLALSENDYEYWAGGSVIGFFLVLDWAGSFSLFSDPILLIEWTAMYVVAGVFWSFISWWFYLSTRKEQLVGYRYKFLVDRGEANVKENTKVPARLKENFIQYLKDRSYLNHYATVENVKFAPSFMDNKLMIGRWIIWWPTSFIWTMLSNPVMRFGHWLAARLKNVYQRISDRVFADFE